MKSLRQIAVILALCFALGIFSGCEHKKPVLIVPSQPPPAAAPSPSPTPEPAATQQNEQQPQEQTAPPQAATSEEPKTETESQEKSKHKKSSRHKPVQSTGEKSNTEIARNNPNKKVIPAEKAEPTPAPGQISPGPTPAVGAQDQASTEQLLQAAESNLNGIKRQLNKDEEIKRAQVKEFISQSRKAITENDLARAHTWAVKAQLLSDELVKQR
jgi:hypothetical protein